MKNRIMLFMGCATLLLLAMGCRSAVYDPIPARPIAVQPVALPAASAAGMTAVPVPVTAAPVASSVAGVEVRTPPVSTGTHTKAVLIAQNHTGMETTPFPLSTLGDWLQTALGTAAFTVVNPHDVIGTTQNVGTWSETMPENSVTRLAENLDAPVLLTASITTARVREIGGTAPGVQAVLEFTLAAKGVLGGEDIASVTAAARSKKDEGMDVLERKEMNTWAELAKEAAFSAAATLQVEYAKAGGAQRWLRRPRWRVWRFRRTWPGQTSASTA